MSVIEEKYHYILSPSGFKRWSTCHASPGFIAKHNLISKVNKYSAEGTVAHEIHEKCLSGVKYVEFVADEAPRAETYIGQKFTSSGFTFKVDDEMAEAVQSSLDEVKRLVVFGPDDMGDFDHVEINVEQRSDLKYLKIPGLGGGTCDLSLTYYFKGEIVGLVVYDYKHGKGIAVDVEENGQALCYAVGVMNKVGVLDEIPVTIVIAQPRAFHRDGSFRAWHTDSTSIDNWTESELIPNAKATNDRNAKFTPSEDACRYCPGASLCSALYDSVQTQAVVEFKDASQLPAPSTLSIEQKVKLLENKKLLNAFIDNVEESVFEEIQSGSKDYEGKLKIVLGRTSRKYKSDADDRKTSPVFKLFKPSEVIEEKLITLTKLEKLAKSELGKDGAKELMDKLTFKPDAKEVLALASDKRTAIELGGEFKDLIKTEK